MCVFGSQMSLLILTFLSVGDGETPLREKEKKVRPFSMFDSVDQSAGISTLGPLRKNQSSEDLLRDAQVCRKCLVLASILDLFRWISWNAEKLDNADIPLKESTSISGSCLKGIAWIKENEQVILASDTKPLCLNIYVLIVYV